MHLSAPDQIRNLLGRYCRLVDSGDFEGLSVLMAHASLHDEEGNEIVSGGAAIADFYRGLVKIHEDGTPRTQHIVANVEFAPQGDGSVTAYSNYLVLQAVDGSPLQPIITGRYVDRFTQGPEGSWHFAQRRFGIGLTGDLTNHMEIELS